MELKIPILAEMKEMASKHLGHQLSCKRVNLQ